MKRSLLALSSLLVCACTGAAAALVAAGSAPSGVGSSTGTTTGTTVAPSTIAAGVTVGGVDVGELTPEGAAETLRARFEERLAIAYAGHTFSVTPRALGASAAIAHAVEPARVAPPGAVIPLGVTIRRDRVRAFVPELDRRFARRPVDARLFLRRLRPWISKERPGRALDRARAETAIIRALATHDRGPLVLRAKSIRPRVVRKSFGPVIVIRRSSNRLYLYRGMRFTRLFGVATGARTYPTPLGRFRIVVKWKNPWWYPPDSPWAEGKQPVPPGPGNPLGTRWMGISAPGVGIHGTPDAASIGYSVSHGCIRMRIPDAEWLFEHVTVGTTVFIVAA